MQRHYQTQNSSIALMLDQVGAQWETDEQGRFAGCRNLYDAETLTKLGYKGWEIEAAAGDAQSTGKKGRITYSFVRDETLERALKAWDAQQQVLQAAEDASDWSSSTTLEISVEDAAKLLCIALRRRKWVVNLWRNMVPLIAFGGRAKTTTQDDKTITTATGNIMSLNASEETRRRLRI